MTSSDGGILVNHSGLDQAAADLGTAVKGIQNRMTQLESELAPLRNDWTGNAQQAYTIAKAKWDGAIDEMQNLLASTSTAVSQSNSDYKSADNAGAARFE